MTKVSPAETRKGVAGTEGEDDEGYDSSSSWQLDLANKKETIWRIIQDAQKMRKSEIRLASQTWFSEERAKSAERFYDKLTFTFAVVSTVLIAVLVANKEGRAMLPWFHMVSYPILMGIRYVQYSRRKWQYFMIDYCYWANLACILYMVFFPQSALAFAVLYSIALAPLPWTVIVYRNSLVFHSIDRYTSFYIHILPCAVMTAIRWSKEDTARLWPFGEFNSCGEKEEIKRLFGEDAPSELILGLGLPVAVLITFFVQQSLELLLTHVIAAQSCCMGFFKVYHDESYLTLFRYSATSGSGAVYKLINICGPRHQLKMWIFLNNLFTFLVSLPVYLWYSYQIANIAFVSFVFCWGTWNGANFYIEVFSRRYGAKKSTFRDVTVQVPRLEYEELKRAKEELSALVAAAAPSLAPPLEDRGQGVGQAAPTTPVAAASAGDDDA